MDRQPVLEGDLVVLRPTTEADRESLFAVASDRLIWEVHPAHDRRQRPVFDAGQESGGVLRDERPLRTMAGREMPHVVYEIRR